MSDGDTTPGDPRSLRALAHPLRLALIDVLLAETTATATRCAELLDTPVNSCSYHLRTLAKYGFIEPVDADDTRERPWRVVAQQVAWHHVGDDELADTLDLMMIERQAARERAFVRERGRLPRRWRAAAYVNAAHIWLTPDQLRQLNQAIDTAIEPYRSQSDPAHRPDGASLVHVRTVHLPLPPTT